jgi:outer membrane protein TolC
MVSKGFRVLHGGGLSSLALILLSQAAIAQTAPAPAKAPAPRAGAAATPNAGAPRAAPAANAGASNTAAGTPVTGPAPGASATSSMPDKATGTSEWSAPDDDGSIAKTPEELDIEQRFALLRAGQGITPDEVAARTVKNNANVESKRRAVETAEYGIDAAKAGYWPQLKLSASYTRLSHVPAIRIITPEFAAILGIPPAEASQIPPINIPVNSYSLDAALSVPVSDFVFKVSHSVSSASQARDAATFDGYAAAASVARDARVNYYQWVRAKAQELVAAQALVQAKGQQKDAQNGFQAGLNSKADVLRTQAGVTTAELAVEQAKNATELARLALQVGMGDASGQNYDVGEDTLKESPELDRLPTIEAAYQEASEHRAEIKSLLAAQKSQREQATATRVAEYPRLDAQGAAAYANPNQRYFFPDGKFHTSWSAGVVLSWTPTAIPGVAAGANAAESKASELAAQERSVRDGLRIEVEQAIKSAEISKLAIESNLVTLNSVREAYRVRRELFRAGRATLVDVTNAATDLNVTRIALVDAFVDSRISLVQLNHALGRDVEQYKDSVKSGQR